MLSSISSYLRTILGRVRAVVFFTRLGAGPASSVSLVRLATSLLASTRDSFGSDGRQRRGRICHESEIAQQKLIFNDIYVLNVTNLISGSQMKCLCV